MLRKDVSHTTTYLSKMSLERQLAVVWFTFGKVTECDAMIECVKSRINKILDLQSITTVLPSSTMFVASTSSWAIAYTRLVICWTGLCYVGICWPWVVFWNCRAKGIGHLIGDGWNRQKTMAVLCSFVRFVAVASSIIRFYLLHTHILNHVVMHRRISQNLHYQKGGLKLKL